MSTLVIAVRVLLLAAVVAAVMAGVPSPVHTFAQAQVEVAPVDPITSIPTPAPITIRPRLFAAYGTLLAAAMLSVLYLYRSRPFILFWLASLLLLATALGITSAIDQASPGAAVNGGALLCLTLSAGLLRLAVDAFPQNPVRWRTALKAAGLIAGWFLLMSTLGSPGLVLNSGLIMTAALLAWAAIGYLGVARRDRTWGALIVGLGLAIVSTGIGTGVVVAVSAIADTTLVTRVAAINVVASLFIAFGMLLLVFEELTDELRRTNRDLATANEAARRLAVTDPLTGCHNRRFFEEIERREMNRHRRYGDPVSVVFIDVNHLKHLNDSEGHARGDDALRAVGVMLRREIRQSDYVFRWGGDEFLLLLTCSLPVAEQKAANLKEQFRQEGKAAQLPESIGLSVGVAAVEADAEHLEDAIRQADLLMYRDKLSASSSLQVR